MRAAVITVSDRVSSGTAEDESGPALVKALAGRGYEVRGPVVVSDDPAQVTAAITAEVKEASLVVTTGGTGLAPRDRVPESTRALADYLVPGIAERMRAVSLQKTPMAMLSRGVAAVVGTSLVINLPGSPAGATENLEAVIDVLEHALDQLTGGGDHVKGEPSS